MRGPPLRSCPRGAAAAAIGPTGGPPVSAGAPTSCPWAGTRTVGWEAYHCARVLVAQLCAMGWARQKGGGGKGSWDRSYWAGDSWTGAWVGGDADSGRRGGAEGDGWATSAWGSSAWAAAGAGAGASRGAAAQEDSRGSQKGARGKGGKGKEVTGGRGGQKPSDDPNFVRLSEGAVLRGSDRGVEYVVERYVASGTFSRVFRVREVAPAGGGAAAAGASSNAAEGQGMTRRWGPPGAAAAAGGASGGQVFAAKVMHKTDSYIQYTSDAGKEGQLLQKLEEAQKEAGKEVLTMRCLDSFATVDEAGQEYWCLILEWLDASLFDGVRANGNRGLHLSMVRILLRQLLEQLRVLQDLECTHTDIKHKNCCLLDTSHFMVTPEAGGRPSLILAKPLAKFIDYGNAVFEGEAKTHPIHTKQFRAPEVLLNVSGGWGPPSDTWTLGITAAFLVSGQLIFNSHEPPELVRGMVETLGPFPQEFLATAKDSRLRRIAETAAGARAGGAASALAARLGLQDAKPGSPESHCVELLQRMLAPAPRDRIGAAEALAHPFIVMEAPAVPRRPEGTELRQLAGASR